MQHSVTKIVNKVCTYLDRNGYDYDPEHVQEAAFYYYGVGYSVEAASNYIIKDLEIEYGIRNNRN